VCGAPKWFSFSPGELRSFISAKPNSPVTIRVATALIIWSRHRLALMRHTEGERDDARHLRGLLGRVLAEVEDLPSNLREAITRALAGS